MPRPLTTTRLQEILRAADGTRATLAEDWSMAAEILEQRAAATTRAVAQINADARAQDREAELTSVYAQRDQARADLADMHAELTAARALITELRENVWLKDVRILQLDGQDRQDLPPLIEAVALAVVTAAREAGASHAVPAMQAFWQRQLRIMTGLLQRLLDQEAVPAAGASRG